MNRYLLVIFGILVISLTGLFAIGYFLGESEKQKTPLPKEKTTAEIISELCKKYESFEAIMTCEQAVNLVLAKYEGEIISIENKQINMPLPQGGEKTSKLIDIWSIVIQLENPVKLLSLEIPIKLTSQPEAETDKLEIAINVNSGATFSLKPLHIIIPK